MKAWFKSRTIWFNALTGVIATLEASVALLSPYFGTLTMQVIVGVIVVGNFILRFDTDEPIGSKDDWA